MSGIFMYTLSNLVRDPYRRNTIRYLNRKGRGLCIFEVLTTKSGR